MSQKTNKSYTKRFKQTPKGKLISRTPGQNHFNAKEAGRVHTARKRMNVFSIGNKDRGRFLPNQ